MKQVKAMSDHESISPTRPRIALLGAGTMGAGMAERLLDQGFTVDVWNRTPGPAIRLAERGATAHTNAAQAVAGADVLLTMLPTGDAVMDVMLGPGALSALRPGAVWAQMGTIGVEITEKLQAEVARKRPDVAFVDAPVSGSREPARNGGLLILASGPESARPILQPVFGALGERTLWLGAAGAGSRLKLVLNTWLAFEVEAAAEVAALADRLGVAPAALRGAVAGGALASGVALTKLAKIEDRNDSPDFSLEWALKDLDLATAAAGVEVIPVAWSIAERWRRLVAGGYGRLDISAARMGLGSAPVGASAAPARRG
jgi:3-hydroxyisobutyrate dehydrogenase